MTMGGEQLAIRAGLGASE